MHPDLPILRESPFDQAAYDRLVQSARGGNPDALAAFVELARMPELKQRAIQVLADLKELEPLARRWATERDPVVGRMLASRGFVADYRQGMRVDAAVQATVLTALNAGRADRLWELPERLHAVAAPILVESCADPELGEAARSAIGECPWFELLAREALRPGCAQEGRRRIVGDERLPEEPKLRAMLLFLRDQFGEAELLDPDGSLLALACQSSDDALRLEVLARLRMRGRTVQALEVLGARSQRGFQEIVSALLVEGRYDKLWDLVFQLPPESAAALLEDLRSVEFVPDEADLFVELLGLLPYRPPGPKRIPGEDFRVLGSLILRLGADRLEALGLWTKPARPRRLIGAANGSVVAVSDGSTFHFYDGQSGAERTDFVDPGCSTLAFNQDGTRLAFADSQIVSLEGHSWPVPGILELAFAGDRLVGLTEDGLLSFRPGWSPEHYPRGGLTGFSPPWAVSRDATWAAASNRSFALLTGPEVLCLPGRFWELAFDAQDRLLLLHRGGLQRGTETLRAFPHPPRTATLSPDRRRLAFVAEDELWVEDLTDPRRAVRMDAPGVRWLQYGQGLLLGSTDQGALLWPTFWDLGPDELERLGPDYRFAYLLARHRHRHALELGEFELDKGSIQL